MTRLLEENNKEINRAVSPVKKTSEKWTLLSFYLAQPAKGRLGVDMVAPRPAAARPLLAALAAAALLPAAGRPISTTDRSAAYSVQLMTGAIYPKGAEPAGLRTVVMTKKGGKKYRCHLPQPPSNESKPDAGAAPPAQPVDEFLGPLVGQCYLKPEGWWTYEVCLSRRIRQYHQEKQAMVKGADGKPTPTGPGQITQA